MKPRKLQFKLEKETKGTFRYKEVAADGDEAIGTLYVRKTAIDGDRPEDLVVTVSEKE